MYKDLSLKEKAKVIREGVRLGLNSIDDILNLYDEAIGHKFLGDTLSKINRFKTPEEILAERYEVEPIVSDNTNVILKPVFTPQEKSYAAALQAFYERHKSPEAEEEALREARQAVKDLKAAEFGTLDVPQSNNLLYAWRRFNNSKGTELLYLLPVVGEAMFGTDVADKLYSGNYGDAVKDLALYGTMTYAPEASSFVKNSINRGINKFNNRVMFRYRHPSIELKQYNFQEQPKLVISHGLSAEKMHMNIANGGNSAAPSLAVSKYSPDGDYITNLYSGLDDEAGLTLFFPGDILNQYDFRYHTLEGGTPIYYMFKDKSIDNVLAKKLEWFNENPSDVTLDDVLNLNRKQDFRGHSEINPLSIFPMLKAKYARVHGDVGDDIIDWLKQNNISTDFNNMANDNSMFFNKGGSIVSPYGQWKYPGKDTIIPSNNITMDYIDYPVLGVSDTGDTKVMMPWNDYHFNGSMVYEHPLIGHLALEGKKLNKEQKKFIEKIESMKNKPDFLQRLYETPFLTIPDWENQKDAASHKISWATDDKDNAIIYPNVQRIDGKLIDFTRPPYSLWTGYESALQRGDTLMTTPEIADWWTLNYKLFYPNIKEFLSNQYQLGGLAKPFSYGDIPDVRYLKGGELQNYLGIPEYNIALYNSVSPIGDFPSFWEALAYRRQAKEKVKKGNIYERDYTVGDTQGEKTAVAAWAKRLGIPYDELDLPVYNGDTVRLPYSLELEIPIDTNLLKNRIEQNKALLDKYSKYRYSDVVDAAIKADLYNLDKLRETYKTGKPVGLTEFGWNSRQLVNNGEIVPIENIQSPLNVLGNYNVRYSPEERRLYYSDEYDFNQFENFVPGEPYRIRGYIDLDNNKALGGNLFKKGGIYIKPSHRGRFTALKKRTGHSASWFKAHGTPALKKMATFELNARHWNKHALGGYLFLEDGQI